MEQETSWSQQLDGNFAERTCFLDVSGLHGHQTLPSPYGMLILKCTRVLLLYVVQ